MDADSTSLRARLAANVRSIRSERGLSQEQYADLCGYHRTYIGSIERGERNITLETLEALAKAFELSPIILLTPRGS